MIKLDNPSIEPSAELAHCEGSIDSRWEWWESLCPCEFPPSLLPGQFLALSHFTLPSFLIFPKLSPLLAFALGHPSLSSKVGLSQTSTQLHASLWSPPWMGREL